MLKRLRKNHPLLYCIGAEAVFLGSLFVSSYLVVIALLLFRFNFAYADDYLLGCIQELVGIGVAVVLLRLDGSYTAVETPLTCGGWMKMSYTGGEIRYTSTETAGESLIIRTEYSTDIGVRNPYNRIDRLVETEVWSDGRVESRDYVPEGSRYTMLKSPDGQHIADSAENGSLTINGTVVLDTCLLYTSDAADE